MTETPQDFDLDTWLEDAERPARSVTVYQKAGLIAELDALEERIRNADLDGIEHAEERGLGEQTEAQRLAAEYRRVAQQFHDSALTITIEGRSEREREDVVLRVPGLTPDQRGAVVLADAITSPNFTAAQVEKLADRLGEVQFSRIVTRFQEACSEMPSVSADFLPKSSTPDDGGE